MAIINMHAHTFTSQNAPKDFLKLYIPGFLARGVDTFTNGRIGAWLVKKIAPLFGNAGKRYASFLNIGKSAFQRDVFVKLVSEYPAGSRFVALTLYMEEMGAGSSSSGFEGQIEQILQVKREYPDELNIFLGIDPRWTPANGLSIDEAVKKYFSLKVTVQGAAIPAFSGLKLYPSTGFYVFDERLKPTFEWAAENEVPVITHCSYLGGIYHNNADYVKRHLNAKLSHYTGYDDYFAYCKAAGYLPPVYQNPKPSLFRRLTGMRDEFKNLVTCSYFLDPFSYIPLLDYFKGRDKPLKICLAHYGGEAQMLLAAGVKPGNNDPLETNPAGITNNNWTSQIRQMMLKYDFLYTDVSYTYVEPATHKVIIDDMLNQTFSNRILFGTDYYMTEREGRERENFSKFMQTCQMTQVSGISTWDMFMDNNGRFLGF